MNRCQPRSLAFLLLTPLLAAAGLLTAAPLLLWPGTASAQTDPVRSFPASARRGVLVVTSPPEVTLNGSADRLSPGSRIRNASNLFVLSGALVGQQLVVNYTRDSAGLIHEVWILTEAEQLEKRAGSGTLFNFVFGSDASTTPRDDGKTPFNQLPVYPNQ